MTPMGQKENTNDSQPSEGQYNVLTDPAVWALTLLGALLRWLRIGDRPLWVDEAMQAAASVSELTRLDWWAGAAGNPLGGALQHLLFQWRMDDLVARLPTYLLSLATPMVAGIFVARFASRRAVRIAVLLTATSFPLVYYAQEARGYAVSACYLLLLAWAVATPRGNNPSWATSPSWRSRWQLALLATVLTVGSSHTAPAYVTLLWLFGLWTARPGGDRLQAISALPVSALLVGLPVGIQLMYHNNVAAFHETMQTGFDHSLPDFVGVVTLLTGPHAAMALLWLPALLVGVAQMGRRRDGRMVLFAYTIATAATLAVAVGIDFAIHIRYFLVVVPLLLVAVAIGFARLLSRTNHNDVAKTAVWGLLIAPLLLGQAPLHWRYVQTDVKLTHGLDYRQLPRLLDTYDGPVVVAPIRHASYLPLLAWYGRGAWQDGDTIMVPYDRKILDIAYWQRMAAGVWPGAFGGIVAFHPHSAMSYMQSLPSDSTLLQQLGSWDNKPCAGIDDLCARFDPADATRAKARVVQDVVELDLDSYPDTDVWKLYGVTIAAATMDDEPFDYPRWKKAAVKRIRCRQCAD